MHEIPVIEQIRKEIEDYRDDISLWLSIEPSITLCDSNFAQTLNGFVAASGYNSIGNAWEELTRKAAQIIAAFILSHSIAHDVQTMDYDIAKNLANRFLENFSTQARFFTNSLCILDDDDVEKIKLLSWQPITNATFDTGIVVLDMDKIGVLWVQEED